MSPQNVEKSLTNIFVLLNMKRDTSDLYELDIHPFIRQLDFVTPHFLSTQFGEKRWRENVFYIKCGTLMKSCVNHAYS